MQPNVAGCDRHFVKVDMDENGVLKAYGTPLEPEVEERKWQENYLLKNKIDFLVFFVHVL